MTSFLIAIALCYILFKIPFWILGSIRGGGRSFIGSLIRGFIAYKTFGLIRGTSSAVGSRSASPKAAARESDPYARTRSTADGQYMLPLAGLTRRPTRKPAAPQPESSDATSARRKTGRQGALFTKQGTPARGALLPKLGPGAARIDPQPGEQQMLPIPARHVPDRTGRRSLHDDLARPETSDPTRPDPQQPTLFTRTGRPRPAARPPRPGTPGAMPSRIRPGEQYYLPLPGRFTSQAAPPSAPEPPAREAPDRTPGQQALLTIDGRVRPQARARRPRPPARPAPVPPPAYKGIRPDRQGQYRLPLDLPKKPARPRTPPAPVEKPRTEHGDPGQQPLPLNSRQTRAPRPPRGEKP